MLGLITLDIYNIDIAVFGDEETRNKTMPEYGVSNPVPAPREYLGRATLDYTDDDSPRLNMVLTPEAGKDTWVHECSHICDFVMDILGLPTGIEGTEVRAYLMGYVFVRLCEIMEGE